MVVEDNTGLTDANAYVTIAYTDDYLTSHGNSAFSSLTQTQKEVAIVKATDYIDNVFDWYGKKKTQTQGLNFPRVDLYDKVMNSDRNYDLSQLESLYSISTPIGLSEIPQSTVFLLWEILK